MTGISNSEQHSPTNNADWCAGYSAPHGCNVDSPRVPDDCSCAEAYRHELAAERRIVEWLREQGRDTGYLTAGQSAIHQVADAIERGEHRG